MSESARPKRVDPTDETATHQWLGGAHGNAKQASAARSHPGPLSPNGNSGGHIRALLAAGFAGEATLDVRQPDINRPRGRGGVRNDATNNSSFAVNGGDLVRRRARRRLAAALHGDAICANLSSKFCSPNGCERPTVTLGYNSNQEVRQWHTSRRGRIFVRRFSGSLEG